MLTRCSLMPDNHPVGLDSPRFGVRGHAAGWPWLRLPSRRAVDVRWWLPDRCQKRSNTQMSVATEKKPSVDERREQEIASWLEKIREWDWLPVIEAIEVDLERGKKNNPKGSHSTYGNPISRTSIEASF